MPAPAARATLAPLAAVVLSITACEAPPIRNVEEFCQDIQNTRIPPGGRSIWAGTAYTKVQSNQGTVTRPFSDVPIRLTVKGGVDGDPDQRILVCPGDCLAAHDADFARETTTRTDDNGVFVFTAYAAAQAYGFVLLDFGEATCVMPVSRPPE